MYDLIDNPLASRTTSQSSSELAPSSDTLVLPTMLTIPSGRFIMGGLDERDGVEGGCVLAERPAHPVYITSFEMSKYPITFDEYDAFCLDTRRPMPADMGWGRGNRPVINISWQDAQDYCKWLCSVNGWGYRLPSEAEWEYTARSQTNTAYFWGTLTEPTHANHQLYVGKTSPVGSYPANPFGIHDMQGNTWEWVQDCWHANYQNAPSDHQAWEHNGNCEERVLRGGSWNDRPRYLRAAYRVKDYATTRRNFYGIRIARSL